MQIHGGAPQTVAYKEIKLTRDPKVELAGLDEDALNALLVDAPETGTAARPQKKKRKRESPKQRINKVSPT